MYKIHYNVYRQQANPSSFSGVNVQFVANNNQHPQIRPYPSFMNAAQPKYQTIQVPMNPLTQFNGLNQQYAIVQSPNKSMMAVTLLPKQQINQIPVILQPNQMNQQHAQQASVLQLNQNFNNNNNQLMANNMNIQNIKTINNITHINNNAINHQTMININDSNKANAVPELVNVPDLVNNNNKGSVQNNILTLPTLPLPAFSGNKQI